MRLSPRSVGVAVAVVLAAGLLSGCSSALFATGPTSATTTTAATATATAVSTDTVPEPVVTAVGTPTQTTSTLPGVGKPVIRLGNMNTQEQSIIGELYYVALEHEGYTVYPNPDVGGTFASRIPALQNNKLDLYPEYLRQWNGAIAHLHRRFKTLAASYAAGQQYAHKQGVQLLQPTPFSNTNCVAVLSQYAAQNHVHSIAELARGPGIIFGAPPQLPQSDGLPRLEAKYHFHPAYVQPIGVGQYWGLGSGDVQAAFCTTTDPQLDGPKYVQLADPKHIFGYGNVVPVTTPAVINREGGKAFVDIINRIDSLLTLRAMRGLNAEIESGHDAGNIAYQFLAGNRVIIPAERYAPVPTTTTATTTATTTGT